MTKRVFFLGAGFSKAIDNEYPLMNQLTEDIETKLTKLSVSKHYGEIAPAIKENIESLLTYLLTNFPWKTETTKYENRALYEEIVKLISQKFSDLAKKSIQQTLSCRIAKSLSQYVVTHPDECNFITLNYDLLLEEVLLSEFKKKNSAPIKKV